MVESWVALAWVVTAALLPVAVWAGMQWGQMKAEDASGMRKLHHPSCPGDSGGRCFCPVAIIRK
jgi:hypothetical protein